MPRVVVGVSLKSYFSSSDACTWFGRVAVLARQHPAVTRGSVDLFVLPSYLQIQEALRAFAGTRVLVGAQDVSAYPPGAYTGEVTAAELREVGARLAEVGHAERRVRFGETDEVTAGKVTAAITAGLTTVVCVGESTRMSAKDAAAVAIRQLNASVHGAPNGQIIVAYEPVWAIGSTKPASIRHISSVARAIRSDITARRPNSTVIYGGSAGPGLLGKLGTSVDGLFLGRLAHDPSNLRAVLDDAADLAVRFAGEPS